MDKILVIIVTYNGEKWINNCLSSIYPAKGIDGIVIDNGSTDNTKQIIKKKYPFVKLVESDKNLGFGQGNNIGIREAIKEGYDFVYFLNQDAWISPDDILELCRISKTYPEYGIISPLQTYAGKRKLDKDFLYSLPKEILEDMLLDKPNMKVIYPTDIIIPAAHWLISVEKLKIIGGFSPSFIHFGEDDNLFQRNHYWGFKAAIVPSIKGVHDREDRIMDERYKLRIFHGALRFHLSNPRKNNINYFKILLGCIRKLRILPIETSKVILKVTSDYSKITKFRKESRKKGAFL